MSRESSDFRIASIRRFGVRMKNDCLSEEFYQAFDEESGKSFNLAKVVKSKKPENRLQGYTPRFRKI